MPRAVYQLVVPLHGCLAIAVVFLARSRVHGQTGRDPIVFRPFRSDGTAHGFLESILVVGIAISIADVAANALAFDWVGRSLAIAALRRSPLLGAAGLALLTFGVGLYAIAVQQMGQSWRIGIDHAEPGPLVTRGLYAHVRHPIYTSGSLVIVGLAALFADGVAIAVAAAGLLAFSVQARLEEEFLRARYPEAFAVYESRTGRFWPKFSAILRGSTAPGRDTR
jgi:protein-S-isoprenylcysteine O-methyltransferase Ste14